MENSYCAPSRAFLFSPSSPCLRGEFFAALSHFDNRLNLPAIEFGDAGIGVENRSERRLERPQPRLVIAPALHTLLENGLAHLLVAEGVEGAFALVIFETGFFER